MDDLPPRLLRLEHLCAELVDNILVHFTSSEDGTRRHDARSLSNLCLVSRGFRRMAQPYLFRTVELKVGSESPMRLLNAAKARPDLSRSTQELSVEFGQGAPTALTIAWRYQLRQFLPDLLPLLENLATFKTDHHFGTTTLVESELYKQGNGYSMGIPADMRNLKTLELVASTCVFRYNNILRLPRLETIYLSACEVFDNGAEDEGSPNDWGWTSDSIKHLILRPIIRQGPYSMPLGLRSHQLQALARSMPRLESLRIEHFGSTLNPKAFLCIAGIFESQLRGSLRRLELCDGRLQGAHRRPIVNRHREDKTGVLDTIQSSKLEYLQIDFTTLFGPRRDMSAMEAIGSAKLPPTLRHLSLRYVEMDARDTSTMLKWDGGLLIHEIQNRFPSLERITLELHLFKEPDHHMVEKYEESFSAVGIAFNVLERARPIRRVGIIISPSRSFNTSSMTD